MIKFGVLCVWFVLAFNACHVPNPAQVTCDLSLGSNKIAGKTALERVVSLKKTATSSHHFPKRIMQEYEFELVRRVRLVKKITVAATHSEQAYQQVQRMVSQWGAGISDIHLHWPEDWECEENSVHHYALYNPLDEDRRTPKAPPALTADDLNPPQAAAGENPPAVEEAGKPPSGGNSTFKKDADSEFLESD